MAKRPRWTIDPTIVDVKTIITDRAVRADVTYRKMFLWVIPYNSVETFDVIESSNPQSTAANFSDKLHPFIAIWNR